MKIYKLALAIMASLVAPMVAAQSAVQLPSDMIPQINEDESGVILNFAGFADVTYANTQGTAGSSGRVNFAPIFQIQIGERFFAETELEFEIDDQGEFNSAIEFATVNWMINDNAALVAGKFLSPVGFFFPNMHPSWINKMVSTPAGFGHGGAAPLTDVGLQLRGGKALVSGQNISYAVYVANGPQLGLEGMHDDLDLDLDVEGQTRNSDGKYVSGGRLGWLPITNLEIGASLARGNVVLDAGDMSIGTEPSRSYAVDGVDAAWRATKALEFRGEWIRQRVGAAPASVVPDQATWRAWYVQGAYRYGSTNWETVLRYGDSVSPHAEATFKQIAIGLNYLFRPSAILKLTWEINKAVDADANADRLLLQFAYGF